MKNVILCALAIIPLAAFGDDFVVYNYGYDGDDYWYDEYWEDDYWCDGYWVYYPHGYYCVNFVWWYPWWWDWYWHRCHWCHHFDWDFFYAGFYVVWYDDGCWWFRPRYGRWVQYQLPYSYHEMRNRAYGHGIYLPEKPPRQLNVPYREKEIMNLTQQKDSQLYKRIEQEHKSGNLERMRKDYTVQTKKVIEQRNQQYRTQIDNHNRTQQIDNNKRTPYNRTQPREKIDMKNKKTVPTRDNERTHIIKQDKHTKEYQGDIERGRQFIRHGSPALHIGIARLLSDVLHNPPEPL